MQEGTCNECSSWVSHSILEVQLQHSFVLFYKKNIIWVSIRRSSSDLQPSLLNMLETLSYGGELAFTHLAGLHCVISILFMFSFVCVWKGGGGD